MISASMQRAIDNIINTPAKTPTREEAREALKACGILDKNGNIAERYKNIIVEKRAK